MGAKKLVNLLRGSVAVEVRGAFPEGFLNLCARQGRKFWRVERPDSGTLRLRMAWGDREGLEELAVKAGCAVTVGGQRGLPPFLRRFRGRYAFLLGLALSLAAVCILSRFILVVEVEGNERVPTQVILSQLRREGLRPGVYGPSLAVRDISNRALLELDELSWLAVNVHGIRAQVIVREKTEPPERVDKSVHGDIVAEAPGIVTQMEVWSGDGAVEEGATVLPGDVLIRGSVEMEPPEYSGFPTRWLLTRAMGRVEGRTWRTLSACMPLTGEGKSYTGEEKRVFSVGIFGQRVNFYRNSGIPYERYDKITEVWNLTLPGGVELPFSLRRETLRAYETAALPLDEAAGKAALEAVLTRRLEAQLGETGEVVTQHFSARTEDGILTVVLTAECREELGRFVPAEESNYEGAN